MAQLRALVGDLGFENVATYVQSGNVVFGATGEESEDDLVGALEEAFEAEFGFEVPVIVRSAVELAQISSEHPLDDGITDAKFLLVGFLDAQPDVELDDMLDPADFEPDHWELSGRELYLAYPNGSGRSKLTNALIERRLGVRATTRNWRTVNRLAQMIDR